MKKDIITEGVDGKSKPPKDRDPRYTCPLKLEANGHFLYEYSQMQMLLNISFFCHQASKETAV
jgi:hypothetical protein